MIPDLLFSLDNPRIDMAHHCLNATPDTVHLGGFSAQLPPALVVQSGDSVEVETFTGFGVYRQAPSHFLPPELVEICETLSPDRKVGSGPHLLTGPIWIEDATPGQTLEIRLESITPRLPVGFNAIRAGKGSLPQAFERSSLRFIDLDLEAQTAEFPPGSGIQIPLTPFFGILGVATDETSRSSIPPGIYGGNMDNRQLLAGSRVFLPIFRPGALFSIGDGHASQGDGEVNGTAIETSMNGRIQLTVRPDIDITTPFAETPTHWILMGFGDTLDQAFERALQETIAFLHRFVGLDPEEAYVLCSMAVHFHITQVVNAPTRGVHGLLPKRILAQPVQI